MIFNFPPGSAGGLDGLTPQHLKDLIRIDGEDGALLEVLTDFINLVLRGSVPPEIRPIFFGGRILALSKKDGGIRPIAVGNVLRRIAAKAACQFATQSLAAHFGHLQVGVGVRGGMEAAVHATRRFVEHLETNQVVVKLKRFINRLH